MFATIEVNGATHIAIHIPHEGAEKTLPALAAMFEQNAVFIKKGYQEMETVRPVMGILLGSRFRLEQYGVELEIAVPEVGIAPDGFTIATPDVFVSNAVALKNKDAELSKARTELSYLKQELEGLKNRLAALSAEEA